MLLNVTLCLRQACMSQEYDTCNLVVSLAFVREILVAVVGGMLLT